MNKKLAQLSKQGLLYTKNIVWAILQKIWENRKLLVFLILILLFLGLPKYRLYTGAAFLVMFGFNFLLKEELLDKVYGGLFLAWGLSLFVFKISILSSLLIFVIFILFSMVLLSKIHPIWRLILLLIYLYASFIFLSPLSQQSLDSIFSRTPPNLGNILFFILGFIFISLSFYVSIKTIITLISKIKKNVCKLDNPYFILSITLIIIILFIGIYFIRDSYKDDYPFSFYISYENTTHADKYNFDCTSLDGSVYLIDDKWVECSANFTLPENHSLLYSESVLYMRSYGNNWSKCNSNDFLVYSEEDGTKKLLIFRFRLNNNARGYQLDLNLDNLGKEELMSSQPFLESTVFLSSEEDYRSKIFQRTILIGTLLSIALFSVFSAMSNLKEILKNEISADISTHDNSY